MEMEEVVGSGEGWQGRRRDAERVYTSLGKIRRRESSGNAQFVALSLGDLRAPAISNKEAPPLTMRSRSYSNSKCRTVLSRDAKLGL